MFCGFLVFVFGFVFVFVCVCVCACLCVRVRVRVRAVPARHDRVQFGNFYRAFVLWSILTSNVFGIFSRASVL